MKQLIAITILFIGISACNCKSDCEPYDYQTQVIFKNYLPNELNPVKLRLYTKDSDFNVLNDSLVFNIVDSITYNNMPAYSITFYGNDSSDYEIVLPNATQRLTKLGYELISCGQCGRRYRPHSLRTYHLNGVVKEDGSNWILIEK